MYLQKVYKAGQTIEIQKTFSKRYGRNITRGKNQCPTPKAMKNYNDLMARRELTRTFNENFADGDIHLVLRHRRGTNPTPDEAKAMLDKYIRQVRTEYRRLGYEIVYARASAVGKKGGIHHHLVVNVPGATKSILAALRTNWLHGSVNFTPLYTYGEFSGLAKYFLGQGKESENDTEDEKLQIIGNRWSGSKNLRRVKPDVKQVSAKKWREPPKAKKGYRIDVDSIDAGVNPVTDIPYLFYRMVKIDQTGKAAERVQAENRKAVRDAWNRPEWANQHIVGRLQETIPKRGKRKSKKPIKPVAGPAEP
ncbi:MAG: hypothetical protein ACK5JF_02680 [Oscillospiraceae bacterium]